MASKERVLALLEEHRGAYLSGEAIAGQLNISRNAVWKAICSLREQGFVIEAVTRRGYCLTGAGDLLTRAGIASFLKEQTYTEYLQVYDCLPSTSRTAKELAIAGAAHGTAVAADSQSAGAGKGSSSFLSPSGGLYMSVVMRPEESLLGVPEQFAKLAAVAAHRAVAAVCGIRPEIRELNNLYVDGQKICGILTESGTEVETGDVLWVVVGIGILTEHLKAAENGAERISRNRLAAEILNCLLDRDWTQETLEESYKALM